MITNSDCTLFSTLFVSEAKAVVIFVLIKVRSFVLKVKIELISNLMKVVVCMYTGDALGMCQISLSEISSLLGVRYLNFVERWLAVRNYDSVERRLAIRNFCREQRTCALREIIEISILFVKHSSRDRV